MTASLASLHIAEATPADADTLSQLAIEGFSANFGHLYAPEHLAAHLEKTCSPAFFRAALKQGDHIFLATCGGTPAGYAKSGPVGLPVEPSFPAMELHRLYVMEPFQGQRIGDALIQAVLARPPIRAARGVYVGAWESNYRAHRFYGKYGFTQVGEYEYRVGPHIDRELILLRKQEPL